MKNNLLLVSVFVIGLGVLFLSTFTQDKKQEEYEEYVEVETFYADSPVKSSEKKVQNIEILQEKKELKNHLKTVAIEYEKNMQFPPYSQPLSKKQFDLLNPNIFRKIDLNLDPNGDVKASLHLNAFRIFKGEKIEVDLTLTSQTAIHRFNLENIKLLSKQEVVADIAFVQDRESENIKYFSASFTPSLKESESWAQELLIRAAFHDEKNKKYVIASNFKYLEKEAELVKVEKSYIEKNELVIPLELATYSDGRYLVKANLFTKTGEPIVHVYAKEDMKKGRGKLLLKVHASSLRLKNAQGPYILKDFTIVKLITSIGEKKSYGQSNKSEYEVNGFSLDWYSNEPYYNEAQEQKLAFLKKLAS